MEGLPFPTQVQLFVAWLASSGAGLFFALLLERIPKFKAWKSPLKGLSVAALFVGLPIVGKALILLVAKADPVQLASVDSYLASALFGLQWYLSSQAAHAADPSA